MYPPITVCFAYNSPLAISADKHLLCFLPVFLLLSSAATILVQRCDEYETFIEQVIAPHIREVAGVAADAAVIYQYVISLSVSAFRLPAPYSYPIRL